jgi:hypothetical protein
MLNMFRDGYYWMDKTMRERVNYGLQLKEALEDFTKDFVPHMKEEEDVSVYREGSLIEVAGLRLELLQKF